jgi:hypothetical protein
MAKKKKIEQENPNGLFIDPLMSRPKRVAIVALGVSAQTFIQEYMSTHNMRNPYDEVWALNRGLRGYPHDKLFVMDDLRWLERKDKVYAKMLQKHDKPIITCFAYPDYPMSVEYPLQDVGECIKDDVFAVNTVAYMVAYAIYIGVEEFAIFGADFSYPDGSTAESGGQAVAYLLGMAKERGLRHILPQTTTLLYANKVIVAPNGRTFRESYGYHRRREMAEADEKKKGIAKQRRISKRVQSPPDPLQLQEGA